MDLEFLVKNLFIHQITIKFLHFQSKKRTEHTDLDNYYSSFSENMDKLIECNIARVPLNVKNMELEIHVPESSVSYLKHFRNFLIDVLSTDFLETHISTIVDDMLIDIDRTIYLLKFS